MKARLAYWLLYFGLLLWAAFACGCTLGGGAAVEPAITAMGGGRSEGSGASMTPPPASAEPSEQHAVEEEFFAPPPVVQAPTEPAAEPFHPPADSAPSAAVAPAVAASPTSPPVPPRPIYRRSETFTRLGAQQEVAPMLKQVSGVLGRMNRAHWLGVLAIAVGLGGILHSAGNKETGYPVVWLKILGGGVLAVVMGDALWFWILCGLAFLLYFGQKLGIIRVPPL